MHMQVSSPKHPSCPKAKQSSDTACLNLHKGVARRFTKGEREGGREEQKELGREEGRERGRGWRKGRREGMDEMTLREKDD